MKSKESLFKDIMALSIRKVKQRSVAGARDEFQQRMKNLPTKIHELNADPYMFIFDALIEFPEQVDFTLTQYQIMIEESFLNPNKNSALLVRHFRKNIDNHSFRIIQILMNVRDPNLDFFSLFFEIHNSVAMPENVLENFRFTGYKWLARAFNFRQYPRPGYIDQLTSGILKSENRNLPTLEDENRSREKYILKMLNHMTLSIENNLKPETQKVQSKYGFCFMCLNPAQYYCKDTKIPVCSPMCKKAHLNYTNNNPAIDFQYNDGFREEMERMLISNLKNKKNVAISIDYICSIYMNSQHCPKQPLPHKELLNSPVIVERIWVLYTMYYYRSNQVFEHIFADGLKNKIDYICINTAKYFLMIVETQRIFEVYQYLDCYGSRRILPTIINNLHDEENKIKFIYSLIHRIFESQSLKNVGKVAKQLQDESALISTLLRAINYDKNPLQKFKEIYGEGAAKQMAHFIIKNEQHINKTKVCEIILPKLIKSDKNIEKGQQKKGDDTICHVFLQELLLEGNQLKFSPFIDEIVRQVFYFLNTKVSDSIYSLLQILYNVLDLAKVKCTKYNSWKEVSLEKVFSPENTTSKDTIFQFAYFIIMIVTELNQYNLAVAGGKKDKKNITLQQFFDRFKHFDAKFIVNMKGYMTEVYNRLVDFPFSVESRGVLCGYPSAKKEAKKGITFHPVRMLLDNWELIYQCLSKSKNDSNILYRCCKCLIDFPSKCQPFFELLLNKLVVGSSQSQLNASSQNIQKDENLLLYINNIMQEEPNCIGTTSWKYLFLKDPSPVSSSHKFLFEIGTLIHYSKMLTFGNFIWFVREFCRNVKLSENYQECLSLLSFNMRVSLNSSSPEQRQRIAIINKQYLDLFQKQCSVYYKIELIKDSFRINNLQFAIKLLDIIEVNIVSEKLVILAIIDVLESGWQQIEAYVDKDRHKHPHKEDPQQHARVPNTIWQHILEKVLTICLNAPHLLQYVSHFLLSVPKLHPYFELLNIQHAIESAGTGRQFRIDGHLTKQLFKFQQHIPQMYNAKFCLMQRGEGEGLLQQFVCRQNMDCIVRHFKYFWQIESVYAVLTDVVVEDTINSYSEKQQNTRYNYDELLKVLQQNDYINLMKLENRLEPVISFVVAVVAFLQHKPDSDVRRNYNKQLKVIIEQVLIDKLSVLTKLNNKQSEPHSQQAKQQYKNNFPHFMHVYSLAFAYLQPLFTLCSAHTHTHTHTLDDRYYMDKIGALIAQVNSDYAFRTFLQQVYLTAYNNEDGFKIPPGLMEQEHIATVLHVLYSGMVAIEKENEKKSSQTQRAFCNWVGLLKYVKQNIKTYKRLYQLISIQKPNSKPNKSVQARTKPTDNSQALANGQVDEATQQLLLNQQIRYFKKTLQTISKALEKGVDIKKDDYRTIHQISGILVELLQLGFDFYDPVSQKLQLTGQDKFNYAYQIYESINKFESLELQL